MINVELSVYLQNQKQKVKALIETLSKDFDYVSVLGTDTRGTRYQVMKTGTSVNESSWAERGFVCRIYNGCGYSEYSFNDLQDMEGLEQAIRRTVRDNAVLAENGKISRVSYPVIREEELTESWFGSVEVHPEGTSSETIVTALSSIMHRGLASADFLVDMRTIFEYAHISKIFLSTKKDLAQSYIWSQGYMFPIGKNEKGMKSTYRSFSGMKGTEILEEMKEGVEPALKEVEELLNSERLIPGEYEIICDPSMAGLIAHEAFGHGVEMDMFVKERAKAVEYLKKPVASPKVDMHDGARAADQVSSYLFDDEGTMGTDTLVIEKGTLENGISDLLSAMKLGTVPTGNGKRESFERKAYTRMTNTFFSPGTDSLEEMIRSVKKGYLLENFLSGMEDPKNWGIQCVSVKGREIIDGVFTGKIVAPVYLTGFVPDLLKSISMVSPDLELSGSGACGKGYKEFVKTSTGGPYLKTKGRLA